MLMAGMGVPVRLQRAKQVKKRQKTLQYVADVAREIRTAILLKQCSVGAKRRETAAGSTFWVRGRKQPRYGRDT